MLSREQIERLKPYEEYFTSAVVANYIRNVPADKLDVIRTIWEEAGGEKKNGKMTCGVCQLNFFRKVGKQYFQDKKAYVREDAEIAAQIGGQLTSPAIDEALENKAKTPRRNAKKKEKPEQSNEQS